MDELSRRQRQILALMISGHRPHEIAAHLGINIKSYSTHRFRMLAKVGARTDAQLAAWATLQRFAAP